MNMGLPQPFIGIPSQRRDLPGQFRLVPDRRYGI